jgi:hypothetical protein
MGLVSYLDGEVRRDAERTAVAHAAAFSGPAQHDPFGARLAPLKDFDGITVESVGVVEFDADPHTRDRIVQSGKTDAYLLFVRIKNVDKEVLAEHV